MLSRSLHAHVSVALHPRPRNVRPRGTFFVTPLARVIARARTTRPDRALATRQNGTAAMKYVLSSPPLANPFANPARNVKVST